MTLNNFVLIIGAAKCGSTSLFNYLSEHPQVSSCQIKEPHFFSKEDNFNLGCKYYKSLFNWDNTIHKYALEATPGYTRSTNKNLDNAAKNILDFKKATNSKFKFIYIVRHPIERIESHYTHLEAWKQEPNKKSITEGLDKEIIEVSKYGMQIEEYYKRFDSNDILILNFQDLKNNTLALIKKVCLFLDIDSEYSFHRLNKIYNSNKDRTTINLPFWSTIRKNNLIGSFINKIPMPTRHYLRSLLGNNSIKHIELSPEQKKIILSELQSDLTKQKKYGIDVNSWSI